MKLFFEEYSYDEARLKACFDKEINLSYLKHGKASIPYVGYYFNPEINDVVFILPKVFISEKGQAFNKYDPTDIIDVSPDKNPLRKDRDDEVVFELSAWLYQALKHFADRNKDSIILDDVLIQNIKPSGEKGSKTIIEIILSLIEFHKKHHNLFTYISIVNASGKNKINWAKTISKTTPVVQNNTPFYFNLYSKDKVVNFDEELISLFYSVLNYLNAKFKFRVQFVQGYDIQRPEKVQSLIDNQKGTRLLKKIRRNYFTDEMVQLWNLLYEFFERSEEKGSSKSSSEILLASNFNVVFEDMIDQLISDYDVPKELKEQQDGKIVDHLYKGKSLVDEERSIYFIGDSKYYKETTDFGTNSVYKQFTYAKNIIQYHVNLFNDRKLPRDLRYCDKLTEGYNITPNFFIRGTIDFKNPNNQKMMLNKDKEEECNTHFFNRLFDRDTLFVLPYDINFMFVVSAYVGNSNDNSLKRKIQKIFRDDFTFFIEKKYLFFILEPRSGSLKDAVEKNFKKLIGKIYKPIDSENLMIMALDKGSEFVQENLALISEIEEDFIVREYHIGTSSDEIRSSQEYSVLESTIGKKTQTETAATPNEVKYKAYDTSETVLLGIYKDQKHLDWIKKNSKYNVRLGERIGAVKRNHQVISAKYLMLYDVNDENKYFVFKLSDKHNVWDYSKIKDTGYPIDDNHKLNKYYIYNLKEETTDLCRINLKGLLKSRRKMARDLPEGSPIYIDRKDLDSFKLECFKRSN